MPSLVAPPIRAMPAIALVAVALFNAAVFAAAPEPLGDRVAFKTGYVDTNHDPISDADLPKTVLVRIGVITGGFNGRVNGPDITQLRTTIGATSDLDLRAFAEKLTSLAEPLRHDTPEAKLVIAPKETRVARLATLVAYPANGKGVGGAAFRGSADETFMLVYLDRACTVLGVVETPRGRLSYNMAAPRAGMYFLKVVRESPTLGRAELSAPPRLLTLAITPNR